MATIGRRMITSRFVRGHGLLGRLCPILGAPVSDCGAGLKAESTLTPKKGPRTCVGGGLITESDDEPSQPVNASEPLADQNGCVRRTLVITDHAA